jgi:AcrR family transcriptional regulator
VPAPRRTNERGDRRRRQILDAALAEVRAQAVADVQLAAIAARAGLSASHLLYYFGSRDGVLIAAVAYAEDQLASGRRERLREVHDPDARLAAFVEAYLPDDRHDPVWKLWIEGWLRSPSRAEFAPVGSDADRRWMADLVDSLEYAASRGVTSAEPRVDLARRFLFYLDGLAVHVLADHLTPAVAAAHAMTSLRSQLPGLTGSGVSRLQGRRRS